MAAEQWINPITIYAPSVVILSYIIAMIFRLNATKRIALVWSSGLGGVFILLWQYTRDPMEYVWFPLAVFEMLITVAALDIGMLVYNRFHKRRD